MQLSYQGVFYGRLTENIVRRHASLAAVEIFSKNNPLRGQAEVRGAVHDAGTLATQLQHSGGQMFRRAAQHLPPHALTAGEKDEVILFFQERGVLRPPASDHRHILRGKALCEQLVNDLACGGRIGAGLDDGRVARGDSVRQWVQGQKKGGSSRGS